MKITKANNSVAKHPMQPLVTDENGTVRFKQNKIIRYLVTSGTINLNDIAVLTFSDEDQMQLAQLLGYSISGYGDLSYVSDESYEEANKLRMELSNETII